MITIQKVRGTRDFYPEDLAFRKWLFGVWRKVSQRFGYEEYDGPFLEPYELFAAKSGQELVNEQMYQLTDRGDRKLGIRPEMTPTLARMVAARRNELTPPIRWYSIPICWRYEKPQKGRVREFAQYNVDVLGVDSPRADAEIIAIGVSILKELGFTKDEVYVRVNNRFVMEETLTSFGIPKEKISQVFAAIDKKERLPEKEFEKWLTDIGLTSSQQTSLQEFLRKKAYPENSQFPALFEALESLGVSEYVEFDPVIVRGIDYYTGTVFEAFDRKKQFRSIFAGGRYDDLVEVFGGGKLPGVGFGMGEVVVEEILRAYNKVPPLVPTVTQVLVTVFNESFRTQSQKICNVLRENGINAEVTLPEEKIDKQLKYANKKKIPFVLLVGPDEVVSQKVTIKEMKTGNQQTKSIQESIQLIRSYVRT